MSAGENAQLQDGGPGDDDAPPLVPGAFRVPFLEWMGGRFVRVEGGQTELRLPLGKQHLNSWKVSHGGVAMTLLDVAMSSAARSAHPDGLSAATVEMKTSFLRPGTGTLLTVHGKCYYRSSTLAFCEAQVRDDQGELVASGSGTFKYIRRRPTPGGDG
ncbi:hypothetical protein GCM10023144_29230 [Pigmentiphaga soli]|uniref:Thioesterase domain-containing protein n=1 Tax=Pigmentiphaga soli TaxID=1007095 RepID=A0ABP8H816_9BURK